MQVSRFGREFEIARCRSVVKVAIPQRRGSELPMTAMRRSGVMCAPRPGLRVRRSRRRRLSRSGRAARRASATGSRSESLAGYATRALNPLAPTSMLARPPPTKIACPIDSAANPIAAWPSSTRIQVSDSASSAQLEPAGSSIRSSTKCWLATRTVRLGVRCVGCRGGRSGQALATATPLSIVQFALPAIVEQAKCRVAALLNLGEHDAGADGVDGAGRNEDDVAFRNRRAIERDRRSSRPRSPRAIAAA